MGKRGATLVELMTCMAIVVLIAGVAIPILGNARTQAIDGQDISNLKQILVATELYRNDGGSYAPKIASLVQQHYLSPQVCQSRRDPYAEGLANKMLTSAGRKKEVGPFKLSYNSLLEAVGPDSVESMSAHRGFGLFISLVGAKPKMGQVFGFGFEGSYYRALESGGIQRRSVRWVHDPTSNDPRAEMTRASWLFVDDFDLLQGGA